MVSIGMDKGFKNNVGAMVESIVGSKWSLHVLDNIRKGTNRPGALVRTAEGLTRKVLTERLNKMLNFGILEKVSYPEVPPRVEYFITPFGNGFCKILDQVSDLQRELDMQL